MNACTNLVTGRLNRSTKDAATASGTPATQRGTQHNKEFGFRCKQHEAAVSLVTTILVSILMCRRGFNVVAYDFS